MIVAVDEFSSVVLGPSSVLRPLLTQVTCLAGRDLAGRDILAGRDTPGEKALARVVGLPASVQEIGPKSVLSYIEYLPKGDGSAAMHSAAIGYLCWQRELDVQALFELLPRFEPRVSRWYFHVDRDLDLFVVGLGFVLAGSPGLVLNWRDPARVESELRLRGLWSEVPPGASLVKVVGTQAQASQSSETSATPQTVAVSASAGSREESPDLPPIMPMPMPIPIPEPEPLLPPIMPMAMAPSSPLGFIPGSGVQQCLDTRGTANADQGCGLDDAGLELLVRFFAAPNDSSLTPAQLKLATDAEWRRVSTSFEFQTRSGPDARCLLAASLLPARLRDKFVPLGFLGRGRYGLVMRVRSLARNRLEVLKVGRVDGFLAPGSGSEAEVQQRAYEAGLALEVYEQVRFRLQVGVEAGSSVKRMEALAMDFADMTLHRALLCARFERQEELALCDQVNILLRKLERAHATHGDMHFKNVVLKRQDNEVELLLIDFARASFKVYEPQIDWLQAARGFHLVWQAQRREPDPVMIERALAGFDLGPGLRAALPSLAALDKLYKEIAQSYIKRSSSL
jgi:hypothetical protein